MRQTIYVIYRTAHTKRKSLNPAFLACDDQSSIYHPCDLEHAGTLFDRRYIPDMPDKRDSSFEGKYISRGRGE